ncbi:hypothetical protein BDZ89DRAFT_419194 [Hymenopellis radicata]|nr:hypothetical protein BDZ89DRAFT_419194 [Hymenopellis radicata]
MSRRGDTGPRYLTMSGTVRVRPPPHTLTLTTTTSTRQRCSTKAKGAHNISCNRRTIMIGRCKLPVTFSLEANSRNTTITGTISLLNKSTMSRLPHNTKVNRDSNPRLTILSILHAQRPPGTSRRLTSPQNSRRIERLEDLEASLGGRVQVLDLAGNLISCCSACCVRTFKDFKNLRTIIPISCQSLGARPIHFSHGGQHQDGMLRQPIAKRIFPVTLDARASAWQENI